MNTFWKILGIIIVLGLIATGLYFIFRQMPVSMPVKTEGKKSVMTFTDPVHGVSFDHVSDMAVTGIKPGDTWTENWRADAQSLGLVIAKGTIDRSVRPKTNFAGATFTVGESNDPSAISSCLAARNGESAAGSVAINGVNFSKFNLGDAGAGNRYDTTSYRAIRDGRCFALEYMIHSTNIGNYDPSQGISQFDKVAVTADLETSVLGFAFLPATNRDYSGTWTGVEGTSLAIAKSAKGVDAYDLKFVTLDGPVSAKATMIGSGAFRFVRDGKNYVAFPGTGDDTGMKYLMGKNDCIVVAPYEGYCKD